MENKYKPNTKEKAKAKKAAKILKAYISKFEFELWAVSKSAKMYKL